MKLRILPLVQLLFLRYGEVVILKCEGRYSFKIDNKKTGEQKEFLHTNFITKMYRYFSSYNRQFSWCYSFSEKNHIISTLYLVKEVSNFPNPLILSEPFYTLNINGITSADYISVTLGGATYPLPRINCDSYLTEEGAFFMMKTPTPINGPFSFRGALTCGYPSLSHVYSALNFPVIDVSDSETLDVTFSILNRWS